MKLSEVTKGQFIASLRDPVEYKFSTAVEKVKREFAKKHIQVYAIEILTHGKQAFGMKFRAKADSSTHFRDMDTVVLDCFKGPHIDVSWGSPEKDGTNRFYAIYRSDLMF